MNTYNWKCHCGCEIKINAEWQHEPVSEGGNWVVYGFPVEDTIKDMEIVNVCLDHINFLTDPLPPDIYEYNGEMSIGLIKLTAQKYVQHMIDMGRPLKVSLLDPTQATPAQKLLIQLWVCQGEVSGGVLDTCNCSVTYIAHRYTREGEFKEHPHFSTKCHHHKDDVDHQDAVTENYLKRDTLKAIRENHPELTQEFVQLGEHKVVLNNTSKSTLDTLGIDYSNSIQEILPEIKVEFDDQRKLSVTLPKDIDPTALVATLLSLDVTIK